MGLPARVSFRGNAYHKSCIKPPPGGLYISSPFEKGVGGGGLIETGGLFERRGLFNLEMTMVSVLQKELNKVEKLKYKKFYVMQQRIRIKSGLPVGK